MMKAGKTLLALGSLGTLSYFAYQALCDQLMDRIFSIRQSSMTLDSDCLQWLSSSDAQEESLRSFDGLKLSGMDIRNHEDDRYIIMVHGLYSNKTAMYSRAREFDSLGYNLLLIDQRCTGDSQGDHYTYGLKESQDLLLWVEHLKEKHPSCRICLYGVSMGASCVMMSTAYSLPDNVCCLIEDCGFSSLEEELSYLLKRDYRLSFPLPVIRMLDRRMREKYGLNLDDISAKRCLESNEIPILFVHGEADDFVPCDMAKILYNHNKGVRKYYTVPEAGHCQAAEDRNYYKVLDGFIRNYM